MNNYPRVVLTEECMRDGLQIERMQSTDAKLALLDALVDAGLRRIVVGSFVHPKWTPQMVDTDELLGRLQPREGVTYVALALNEKGRQRMAGWTPPLTMDELPGTLLHLDPVFIKRNTNRTMEQQEATWRVAIDAAKAAGATQASIGLSSGWGSNFTGKVDREHRLSRLAEQFDLWTAAGIEVASATFADPMGWVTPNDLAEDLNVLTATYPSITEYYLHLHNTRGLALTSAYAAVGALDSRHTLRLDCAVGGIGGCPNCGNGQGAGMIPTEDLVQLLEAMGIDTGVDLYRLVEASAMLSEMVGRRLDSKVSQAGPLPVGEHLYSTDLPVIETLDEAMHFRLGMEVCAGKPRPWDGV